MNYGHEHYKNPSKDEKQKLVEHKKNTIESEKKFIVIIRTYYFKK